MHFCMSAQASRGPHTRSSHGPAGVQRDVEALLHVRLGSPELPEAPKRYPGMPRAGPMDAMAYIGNVLRGAVPQIPAGVGAGAPTTGAGIPWGSRRPPSCIKCFMFNAAPSELFQERMSLFEMSVKRHMVTETTRNTQLSRLRTVDSTSLQLGSRTS